MFRKLCMLSVLVLTLLYATTADAALVSYYPFDTNLVDVWGGNNGTSGNETHAVISGRTALDTNPGNSHVKVTSGSGAWAGNAVANDEISFSFWQLDPARTSSTTFKGISPAANGGQRGASGHAPWSNNITYFDTAGCCGIPGQRLQTGSTGNTNNGAWHHFAFVKDGGLKSIYRDGGLVASQGSANPLLAFTDLWIGSRDNGAERMTGYIDDFSVFDTALTSGEVAFLAGGGNIAGLVPEPTTLLIWSLLAGLGVGLGWRRRK